MEETKKYIAILDKFGRFLSKEDSLILSMNEGNNIIMTYIDTEYEQNTCSVILRSPDELFEKLCNEFTFSYFEKYNVESLEELPKQARIMCEAYLADFKEFFESLD